MNAAIAAEQDMLLIKVMDKAINKVSKGLAGIAHIYGSCITVSRINYVQIFHSSPKVLYGIHVIISVNDILFLYNYISLCIKNSI